MRVAVDVLAPVREPSVQVQDDHVLGMMLRPGFIEVGLQRSAMQRVTFQAGEMGFFPRRMERWVGTGHQERLLLHISDAALRAAREGISGAVEAGHLCKMVDVRLARLRSARRGVVGGLSGLGGGDGVGVRWSRPLPPRWWMPLQDRAAPSGRCEADWVRHACGRLKGWWMPSSKRGCPWPRWRRGWS